MPQNPNKKPFCHGKILSGVLILALFISLFYGIKLPLFDVDEGAFSEASREMLMSGDFISPRLDNAPRYDKPILIYWLQTASMQVFGVNEGAARLPAALATCLWAGVIFLFLWSRQQVKTGLMAAIILVSCLEVSIIGKAATADTLLNLWLTCTMFGFFLYFTRRQRRFLLLAFAAMGLGFLTKGPVAVLIPLIVTGLFVFFSPGHTVRHWLQSWFNPAGISIFLIIALPWYIAEYTRDGFAFIEGFFLKHNLGRFNQAMETHRGGWWYYLPIILIGLLPFTSFLVPIFKKWRQSCQDPLGLFLFLWFFVVLLLFSFSSTKLPHYIVYGFTPLIILIAMELCPVSSPDKPVTGLILKPWAFLPLLLIVLILFFLPALLNYASSNLTDPTAQLTYASLTAYFSASYLWIQGLFLSIVLAALFLKRLRHSYALLLGALFVSWNINHYVLPAVATVQQQPIKNAALLAKENHWDVHHWRIKAPSFSFYRQQASLHTPPTQGSIVLTRQPFLSDFKDYAILYLDHGIVLIRLQ